MGALQTRRLQFYWLARRDPLRAASASSTAYRTTFVLHNVQGHEHREIATILGRSIGASQSQLHKARRRLREFATSIPQFVRET
jgi:DNA-directed RNA polymerase specialized sigma24 family protein